MSPPIPRGQSQIAVSTTANVTPTLPAKNIDDLVVLYAGHSDPTHDGSLPALPSGYQILYSQADGTGFDILAYKRIKALNEPNPTVRLAAGAHVGGPLWAKTEVYGNVDYRDPGWLSIPGTAGNYATFTRTALSATTLYQVDVRVSFDTLGIVNWVAGWTSGDMGVGLDVNNKAVIYVNNTLAAPVGNAPSSVAVPGLNSNTKVWIRSLVNSTTATCSYWYSYDDVENPASVHWIALGTPQVGTNAGTTFRLTNSGTLFIGARDAATTPSKKNVYAIADATSSGDQTSIVLSNANPAGFAVVGTVSIYRPTIGQSSPIEDWEWTIPADQTQPDIPALSVYGLDRLASAVFLGSGAATQTTNPIVGPTGWTETPDRSAQAGAVFLRYATRLDVVQASTAQTFTAATGTYTWKVMSLVLRPAPAPVIPPASPQPPHLVLGCAETYSVWFTDGSYRQTVAQAKWGSITYERVLDQISTASVVLPDEYGGASCMARFGGLEPWRYGLLIERNDQEVWSGPVTTVARQGNAIVVGAGDVLARYQKRFLVRDATVNYDNTDTATVFRDVIVTHAASSLDQWSVPVPNFIVGVAMTRALKPREFKYAWDLLQEILNSTIDAYVMNGVLYVWEPMTGWQWQDGALKRQLAGAYNSDFDLVYGTFTEESFSVRPDWTLDGTGQTNFPVVPGADTGEMGFRTYQYAEDLASQVTYGLLDMVDPDPIEIPEDTPAELVTQSLQARANTIAALRSHPPITIEAGVLSQSAPIDFDNLRPGSLWKLDIYDQGFAQLLSLCRLRRVTVNVTRTQNGVEERVSPTLEPPGWQGGFD